MTTRPVIDAFRGEYSFLSNFFQRDMWFEGLKFGSAEAAYQAAKCAHVADRMQFLGMSPGQAKRLGRRVALRPDWDDVRVDRMADVLERKFSQHHDLAQALVATGNALLIEGNTWNDRFWGECRGVGHNWLGVLLMRRRALLGGAP